MLGTRWIQASGSVFKSGPWTRHILMNRGLKARLMALKNIGNISQNTPSSALNLCNVAVF
jgi:hypothetical protein